jgi:hypothetical protein
VLLKGGDVLEICSTGAWREKNSMPWALLSGYIYGAADDATVNAVARQVSPQVCFPTGFHAVESATEMIGIVCRYTERHPEGKVLPFAFLAHEALKRAYPCSR